MTNANNFVHLKVKSHYSILEGSMKISDIVSEAKKNNMHAMNWRRYTTHTPPRPLRCTLPAVPRFYIFFRPNDKK